MDITITLTDLKYKKMLKQKKSVINYYSLFIT